MLLLIFLLFQMNFSILFSPIANTLFQPLTSLDTDSGRCKVMYSFTNTVEKLNRKLTYFIKFIVANCMARLTGLVSDAME